jgi:type IV pilus assembly protein PilA
MYVAAGQPSGKATASLICGIFFFIFPLAIVAIIMGHLALSEIKRSAGRLIGEGRAIAGLVLGYLGIAGIPFLLIIAAIAIPNLLRARMAANEASAMGSVRTLNTAEVTYSSAYPEKGFTCSLESLGGPADDCSRSSGATADHACLIDNVLAAGQKSGYVFSIENCSGDGAPMTHYEVIARPVTQGQSGQRSFCSNQSGVIKMSSTEQTAEGCLDNGSPLL